MTQLTLSPTVLVQCRQTLISRPMKLLSRRHLVGLLAVSPTMPSAAESWMSIAEAALAPLRAAISPEGPPLLLPSWRGGEGAFARTHAETAYTYDNALAAMALLAAGDAQRAMRILEALRDAPAFDRDGPAATWRTAYRAGPLTAPVALPGWWDADAAVWREDPYQTGRAVGPAAFAALAMLDAEQIRPGAGFRAQAWRAAAWLAARQLPLGFRAGTLANTELHHISVEENADLAVLFKRMGWTAEATQARAFVEAHWIANEKRFLAGRTPDGRADGTSAADAQLFPLLALGLRPESLIWLKKHHGIGNPLQGIDFNDDRDGIWTEGTAQLVLALRRTGQDTEAHRIANDLLRYRDDDGWLQATDGRWITTGLTVGPGQKHFRYPPLGHLGATAWLALAALSRSPFDGG